jgi:hypothetical protein
MRFVYLFHQLNIHDSYVWIQLLNAYTSKPDNFYSASFQLSLIAYILNLPIHSQILDSVGSIELNSQSISPSMLPLYLYFLLYAKDYSMAGDEVK